MADIVSISDLIEIKLRKEREVKYYQEQIAILSEKLYETQQELDLNETILNLIRTESIKMIGESE